jgi:Domain of unknown function (DUF4919)
MKALMTLHRYGFGAFLCMCVSCFAVSAQPVAGGQPKSVNNQSPGHDQSLYRQLVERVKGGDMNIDFILLRDSFGDWLCNEKVNTDAPGRNAMVEAFNDKNYAKAVELVEVVLDYEFVHLGLHRAAEDAYRKLGKQSKADFHKDVAEKLLQALMTSGDGKTAESAYRVLTIKEEYFIMNERGYEVHGQALLLENNKSYDVLYGKDKKTGKDVSIYFDISSFFGGCRIKDKKQD